MNQISIKPNIVIGDNYLTMVRMGAKLLSDEQFNSEHGTNFLPVLVDLYQLHPDYQRVIDAIPGNPWLISTQLSSDPKFSL